MRVVDPPIGAYYDLQKNYCAIDIRPGLSWSMALSISVASKWQHANNAPLKNVISVYLSSMTLVTQSVV